MPKETVGSITKGIDIIGDRGTRSYSCPYNKKDLDQYHAEKGKMIKCRSPSSSMHMTYTNFCWTRKK